MVVVGNSTPLSRVRAREGVVEVAIWPLCHAFERQRGGGAVVGNRACSSKGGGGRGGAGGQYGPSVTHLSDGEVVGLLGLR